MKILLDRCVPKRFGKLLAEHDVVHASQVVWGSLTNGELVRSANDESFNVLITVDKNMEHQTSLHGLDLAVLVVRVVNNRFDTLSQTAPKVIDAIRKIEGGKYLSI